MLASCGSVKVPRYDGPIYAFDVDDQVFRYRLTVDVISAKDERTRGATVFMGDDFAKFLHPYIFGCLKWDPSIPLQDVDLAIKEVRGH